MAGESAQREYERQREQRTSRVRRSWRTIVIAVLVAFVLGWLVSIVLMSAWVSAIASIGSEGGRAVSIHMPPRFASVALGIAFAVQASTLLLAPSRTESAWRRGAEGERIVGSALDALSGQGVHALHDRRIPGSRANLDHLAVTPAGVFTVDAKRYTGRLEVRARGREIWIKGRNRSGLLEQAHRQADVVARVLARADIDGVPVTPLLCFVDTQLPRLFAPWRVDGVVLTTPRKLRTQLMARADSPLAPAQLSRIVAALNAALTPALVPTDRKEVSESAPPIALDAELASHPLCDRCDQPMVVRHRRSDASRFYGCSTFPRCRRTRPYGEAPSP
jgi:hypothetical protein